MPRLASIHKILLAALALRLVAALFSTGYLMHDDHFSVIETAASWADGEDYNRWLPWNQEGEPRVYPANFTYVGSQFLLFSALKWTGVIAPQSQMLIVRILHALYSLLIVVFGYQLTLRLTRGLRGQSTLEDQNDRHGVKSVALSVAWILALGGLFPNLSVRNLAEMVCIPPLLWGLSAAVNQQKLDVKSIVITGLGLGLATGLRYQCGLFGVGLAAVLFGQKQFGTALKIGALALVTFALTQLPDLFVWGEPFVQLRAYLAYNGSHAGDYPTGPWYTYLLTLLGLLIPPVSLLITFGLFYGLYAYFTSRSPADTRPETDAADSSNTEINRDTLALWLRIAVPALLFLVVHSIYANKQERFILSVVPLVISAGLVGWQMWKSRSAWWNGKLGLHLERWCWRVFWGLNALALVVFTPLKGKSARVEAMDFMYAQQAQNFLVVQVDAAPMMPKFYAGSWADYYWSDRRENPSGKSGKKTDIDIQRRVICRGEGRPWPEFFLFVGDERLAEEVAIHNEVYPGLVYETTIRPSLYHRTLHRLNPINGAERIMIYRTDRSKICPANLQAPVKTETLDQNP
ncbi:MAG: hypothetical protein P8M07_05740 [Flavobacteriales bacterium]|nr:hypothetical protein [Flavobacteriales bacterium]